MKKEAIVQELKSTKEFFDRSTRPLTDEHSAFSPQEGTFTAAQQIAHVAQTVEWFFEGAFRPEGFSTDWESMTREILAVQKVSDARAWLDRAFSSALAMTEAHSQDDWNAKLPPNPILGEVQRFVIIGSLMDHTAHHRGALTVYSRLCGLVPPMPYMEM